MHQETTDLSPYLRVLRLGLDWLEARRALAVVVLALVAASPPASAELVIADSVELLVARSELVARATVVPTEPHGTAERRDWREVTVELVEVFKGPAERRLTFSAPWRSDVAPKGELLVFLVHGKAVGSIPATLKDKWVATPQSFTFDGEFLSLAGERVPRVVSRTFQMLETQGALLAAVLDAAKANAGVVDASVAVEAPWESPVASALYSGSAVLVRIPADAAAQRWAEAELTQADVGRRLEAAKVFAARRSPANVAHLKRLLGDPGFWAQRTQGVPNGFNLYPVRRLAYDTLREWRIDVPKPMIEEPFTDEAH